MPCLGKHPRSFRRKHSCKACLFLLLTAAAWHHAAAGRAEDLDSPDTSTNTPTTSTSSTPSSSIDHSKRFESPIVHGERYINVTKNAQIGSWEAAVADLPDCRRGSWQDMATGNWHKD